ncbi:MAG: hypothetical protein LBC91_04520 [Candidatus Accumulibacter sp.]|jgi:hypothetical protein|nr:hypothetical protein [Accumulibacter sp.]
MSVPDFPSAFENAADRPPAAATHGFEEALERLRLLKTLGGAQAREASVLDDIYAHSIETVEARLRLLAEISLPMPQKSRQVIRNMQDLLEALARLLLDFEETGEESVSPASANGISPLTLWRALRLLSRHLLISSLTATPPGTGIWRRLHRVYGLVRRQGVAHEVPEGATRSLRDEYFAAILLGCAQPMSFTGRDVYFLDRYIERFCGQVDTDIDKPSGNQLTFWIDPEGDAPARPYCRKSPPPQTPVFNFSCQRLTSLLEKQVAALEAGTSPKSLDLPSFAATVAGLGVLNRLARFWGHPCARRFPRRNQNHRSELCVGFSNLRRLYKRETIRTSTWMITNESPDGYAVMHLSGKTRAIRVGDVAALRTEGEDNWQPCIIRWALSENQEHIELGLQILAPKAYVADIALPARAETETRHRPTLVLPATPTLCQSEALVVPTGTLAGHSENLILVIERDNLEIREISHLRCDERNGFIELYGINSSWTG